MQTVILGYHKISASGLHGRKQNIEVNRLESHVRFFARRNYRFVRIGDLAAPWQPKSVAFTFDDGFQSAVDEGLSCLTRHRAVGTIYVVTDRVGACANWQGEEELPLADWESLRSAVALGHEVGNHTRTHARLGDLTTDQQRDEILGAKIALESEGFCCRSISLPWGSYSAETRRVLESSGMGLCVTARRAIAQPSDDCLSLPRIFVEYGDSLPILLFRLFVRRHIPRLR